jgi:hypothetical protein
MVQSRHKQSFLPVLQSHFSVMVRVAIGTRSNQLGSSVRHCSMKVTAIPPGQTGQGIVDVAVMVVVGHVGQ